MIQIRHVPDSLHRKLKSRAALAGMSLSEFLLREVERIAERPSPEEFAARLARRPALSIRESAAEAVRAERNSR